MNHSPLLSVSIESNEPESLIARFRGERLSTADHADIMIHRQEQAVVFVMLPEALTDEVSNKLGMIAKMFEGRIEMKS